MATHTLSILKPSVNNLTVRIFVRAADLDFEEIDVWGKKSTPDFLAKDPADLTPLLEEEGLPKGSLWESCAIMQYLCNKHGLDRFYSTDPGERAMVDSAMFYLIGTFYPLLARATYPTLRFVDRGHPLGGNARVPARDRLQLPGLGQRVPRADGGGARRRVLGARGRCPRLHRVREVGGGRDLEAQGRSPSRTPTSLLSRARARATG